jgi:hypothetical protein
LSLEQHTDLTLAGVSEDGATVDTNGAVLPAEQRRRAVAAGTEHDDTVAAPVSDDELVEGRARDADGTVERADTHMADEPAGDTEHAHAVVAVVRNSDVAACRHETESKRHQKLAAATAFVPKASKESTVAPVEHTDAVREQLRRNDDVGIDTHAARTAELARANEAVEVEARRQHLHAVVPAIRDKHEVVGCDAHLARAVELQRTDALAADNTAS